MVQLRIGLAAFFLAVIGFLSGCGTSGVDWVEIQRQLDYGDVEAASQKIDEMIAADSLSASALFGKALIYDHEGYLWDAHINCFKAFQADTAFTPAIKKFIDLGFMVNTRSLVDQAVKRLIALTPDDPEAFLYRARLDMEQDRFDSAVAAIERAASLDADEIDIILYRAELDLRSYDSLRIVEALQTLEKTTPNNDRQILHKARLYKFMNLNTYQDVLKSNDGNLKLMVKLGQYLLDDYYIREVEDIVQEILAVDSTAGDAYLLQADVCGIEQRLFEGVEWISNFIRLDPSISYGFHREAIFSAKYVDLWKGLDQYDIVIDLAVNQNYPKEYLYSIYFELQDLAMRAGDLAMAMNHLPKGEQLDTGDRLSDIVRATLMYQFDDARDSAMILVDDKIDGNLENRAWLEKAAWYFIYTGRGERAETIYRRLIELPQPEVDYYLSLLDIYIKLNREPAIDSLGDNIPWRFQNSRVLLEKFSGLYERLNRPDKRFEYARRLYEKSHGYLPYIVDLAELYRYRENIDAGREIFETYCENYPRHLDGWYERGLYAMETDEPETILECSNYCLDIDSLYGSALELRGLYYYKMKQTDSAMHYFRKTVMLNWTTPYAYYYLGEHLLQQGDSLNRAAGLGMAAVNLFEKDRRGFYLTGRAYSAQGKYKLARTYFYKGVKLFPEDAELNYLLGRSYFYLGENDKANQYLRKSLDVKDHKLTSNQRQSVQEMLSQI